MYLLRLDDASEHWNKENWERMHDLLVKYHIRPIISIIPNNEDEDLLKYPLDPDYLNKVIVWINEDGWTPALHGYNHVCSSNSGGLNPVHISSEFADLPLTIQREKIRVGVQILEKSDIHPKVFVAPKHTFDENTLLALKQEADIKIISDTIARDIYYRDGFYFFPQQTGKARRLPFPLLTFCYHPNVMTNESFRELEEFLRKNGNRFASLDEIPFRMRKYDFGDYLLKCIYFTIHGVCKFF